MNIESGPRIRINEKASEALSSGSYSIKLSFEMKKYYLILLLALAAAVQLNAQWVPKGMNYQAVARNGQGELLSNKKINLKIYLFGNENNQRTNHYSELHEVTTNALGLFNIIIGEGLKDQGEFGLIPWNKENIWMEVALADQATSGFKTISNSKLLAVPYAIHAQTADRLNPSKGRPNNTRNAIEPPGVVSTFWSVFGNALTNTSGNPYHTNALGTTDMVDLFLITDNVERLRILKDGNIVTKLNFEIGKNLNVVGDASVQQSLIIGDSLIVKKVALLNTLGGSTYNYGPFTVSQMSRTLLSGTLTVDLASTLNDILQVHGPTDLNSRLWVNNMSPTKLTGTLEVDKTTNLNDVLRVNEMSPTYLSGTLRVDQSTLLHDSLSVTAKSPTYLSGTLDVIKTTVLNDTLTVNNMKPTFLSGTLTVDKEALFLKQVLISDTTQSTSTSSGALVVKGGLGLGGNLNVGGASTFKGPVGFASPVTITDGTQAVDTATGALIVSGGLGILKNLNVGGITVLTNMTSIKDTSESTSPLTGALKVNGGIGIGRNLNVSGNTTLSGVTMITNNMESTLSSNGALKVSGGVGIGLRLNVGGMTSILDLSSSNGVNSGALKVAGGFGIGQQLNVGGVTSILDATQSTSSSTGALKVTGGVGIKLKLNVGGMATIFNTTNSTSTTTGAFKTTGGLFINKNLNVGGDMTINGLSTFNGNLQLNNTLNVNASGPWIAEFVNNTNANGISIQVANGSPAMSNNFMEFRNSTGGVVGRVEGEPASAVPLNPRYQLELTNLEYRITSAGIGIAAATATLGIAVKNLIAWTSSSTGCVGFPVNCGTIPIVSMISYAAIDLVGATADFIASAVGLSITLDDKDKYISAKAAMAGVTYESGNGDYAEWLPKKDKEETFLPGYIVNVKDGRVSKKITEGAKLMVISNAPIILGNMPSEAEQDLYEKVAFLGQVPVRVLGKVDRGDYILPSGYDDGLGIAVHPKNMKTKDYARIVGVAWSASDNESYSIINTAIGLNGNAINSVVLNQKKKIRELMSMVDKRNAVLAALLPGYRAAAGPAISTFQSSADGVSPASSLLSNFITPEFSKEKISQLLEDAENSIISSGVDIKTSAFWMKLKTEPTYREQFIKDAQEKYQQEISNKLEIIDNRFKQ
jgi:hypothetical protein